MSNILYILVCIFLCYVRYKNICKDCDPKEIAIDIIQIVILFLLLRFIITPIVFFKCIGVLLLSFIIKQIILIIFKKKPQSDKKCFFCKDTWLWEKSIKIRGYNTLFYILPSLNSFSTEFTYSRNSSLLVSESSCTLEYSSISLLSKALS